MVSLGLRRLFVSSQNWVQPATRFAVNGTRHGTLKWRVLGSHAKYSTGFEDAMSPAEPEPENAEQILPSQSLPDVLGSDGTRDWSKSYFGLSAQPFAKDIADVLMAPLDPMDVEMKPGKHFSKM